MLLLNDCRGSLSRPEVFSQADSSISCLLTKGRLSPLMYQV